MATNTPPHDGSFKLNEVAVASPEAPLMDPTCWCFVAVEKFTRGTGVMMKGAQQAAKIVRDLAPSAKRSRSPR